MDHSLINISNLNKTYTRASEKLEVLKNINLTINEGEFVALMGPSGSGKTTLLNILAGLDNLDSGSVVISGTALESMKDREITEWRAKNIGFVFQFYNLIPVLTAQENVALPLGLFGMSKAERYERAKYSLEVVGLGDRVNHFPAQLSGGQEQRVAIARAIVTDPKIIVADEPTGDLDRKSATEILELLQNLNQEFKKTIIMVTHDPYAAGYATRIIHFDKGDLVSN